MINGGYADNRKKYKPIRDTDELQAAFFWAEQKGISHTGEYYSHLLQECERLNRQHQIRQQNELFERCGDYSTMHLS